MEVENQYLCASSSGKTVTEMTFTVDQATVSPSKPSKSSSEHIQNPLGRALLSAVATEHISLLSHDVSVMVKKETEIKTRSRKEFLSSSLNWTVSKQQCLLNCSSKGGWNYTKAKRQRECTRASLGSLRLHNWFLPALQMCTISNGKKERS